MNYPTGVQLVGTITVGASGMADATGTIVPVRASAPFKNLSISVVPVEAASSYTLSVYHDGELVETHDFTGDSRKVCHLSYPDVIFPANIGTNAIPKFCNDNQKDFYGIPIRVSITNHYPAGATFIVYSNFEEFVVPRFGTVSQET